MSKHDKPKKSGASGDAKHCVSCKNFDPKKKGGYCRRRDKKRSADDKICGHFDPR